MKEYNYDMKYNYEISGVLVSSLFIESNFGSRCAFD